jgi:predicted Rossmann fold nucleotide-binding protein DprA/Smf involved in DNA uptake
MDDRHVRPRRRIEMTDEEAMQRNQTIAALSDAVLVVVADIKGGSWAQANLCLKAGKKLLVPDGPPSVAAGNQKLIQAGAVPVDPKDPSAS